MSEIKIKCSVCGKEFEPKKEMRYTGISCGMVGNTLYDCYDCPECGGTVRGKEKDRRGEK